jgi:hypothetical protein
MMSPIRHEDDFRRREIDDWDEYVLEQIEESISRGEFEDLPHKGKPIRIWRTDLNPEYDLAFSRLKNAGVLPTWMELDAEVARMSREMEIFLDRSRTYLQRQLEELRERQAREDEEPEPGYPWWQLWRRIADWWRLDLSEKDDPPAFVSIGELIVQRDRMRGQYLDRAAALDKRIFDYHNALPRELSHLQRLRWLPERAARVFDEHVPARMLVSESGVDED